MEMRKSPATELSEKQYPEIVKEWENLDPQLFVVALENKGRNRWTNVLPNEPTRFTIEDEPLFYFNANWVLEKRAIACQGPLETEIDEFWKMAWHADVRTIVMLTNLNEGGVDKCSRYWKKFPCKEEKVFEKVIGKRKEVIVRREIEVKRGGETRTIVQYHLQNWPDFGVVAVETLAQLVKSVQGQKGKILVHCSAGLGRTGAFLATFEAAEQKVSHIREIVSNLRNPKTGRVGLIQTSLQYRLALKTAEFIAGNSKVL